MKWTHDITDDESGEVICSYELRDNLDDDFSLMVMIGGRAVIVESLSEVVLRKLEGALPLLGEKYERS